MSDSQVLIALAEALEAASGVLRQRASLASVSEPEDRIEDFVGAVARAQALHPLLGPRQAEVIDLLEKSGSEGTNTGVLSRAMGYDQPNVYLTLRGLSSIGLVEKDESARPHTYRLASILTRS